MRTSVHQGWRITECLGTYWTDHGQHQKSADFIWRKLCIINRHFDMNMPLAHLNNAHILDFRAKRNGEGIGRTTINRDMSIFRASINHAVDMYAQPAPAIAWRKLRYPESDVRIRFLSIEEYNTLIAHCDEQMAFAIMFAVMTGLRKTAMLDLKWHQVDLNAKTITIPTGKAGRPQVLRIAAALMPEMLRHRKAAGYVFARRNFRKRWEAARARSGVEDFRWHDLRHTFGSWARQNGADLLDVCEAMGHSTVAVTQRYAHIDPAGNITAFDRAGEKLAHNLAHSTPKRA